MSIFKEETELTDSNFGSTIKITIEMTNRGNLTNGMAMRVVDDVLDSISKADCYRHVRWSCFEAQDEAQQHSS